MLSYAKKVLWLGKFEKPRSTGKKIYLFKDFWEACFAITNVTLQGQNRVFMQSFYFILVLPKVCVSARRVRTIHFYI